MPGRRTGSGQPVRNVVQPDHIIVIGPGPDHRKPVTVHQNFRHEPPGVVGTGLNSSVGSGCHHRNQIACLKLRQAIWLR